jgi:hypothetical protein
VHKSKKLLIGVALSKTRVFQIDESDGKFRKEDGLTASQNSLLILASQKVYSRLSLDKPVYAAEKGRSARQPHRLLMQIAHWSEKLCDRPTHGSPASPYPAAASRSANAALGGRDSQGAGVELQCQY